MPRPRAPYRPEFRAEAMRLARGITASMSRVGDCDDNALVERFFAALKANSSPPTRWPTRAAARLAVFAWLEVWYNRQRRHAALAYHSPVSHEDTRSIHRLAVTCPRKRAGKPSVAIPRRSRAVIHGGRRIPSSHGIPATRRPVSWC